MTCTYLLGDRAVLAELYVISSFSVYFDFVYRLSTLLVIGLAIYLSPYVHS